MTLINMPRRAGGLRLDSLEMPLLILIILFSTSCYLLAFYIGSEEHYNLIYLKRKKKSNDRERHGKGQAIF